MKKVLYALLIVFYASCSSGTEKSSDTDGAAVNELAEGGKYACPMKCEGDKTYAETGKCPVCDMDLEEIALVDADSTVHEH